MMTNSYTFSVLGGDRRMLYAAELLAATGFRVLCFGLSAKPNDKILICDTLSDALRADFILLPIPMSKDGKTLFAPMLESSVDIGTILEKAPLHATIFGGQTQAFFDPRLHDYGARSDFATLNAVPTAEGALLLALAHLPCTISAAEIGIVGFGKVGKAVASLFHAAGAKVTVFARRSEVCSVASLLGYRSAPITKLPEYAGELRALINTAPSPVIGEDTLSQMRRDALILELASAPYGVNFDRARAHGIQTILAGGLPGKYAPEAAGISICKTVLTMLCESGIPI